ncbi:interferon regulatory factor 8-like [Centruroides vittatus]|uniref:interferon regulatory factor 8-like n=1 Tax=Centruroides vittatus TaxID=120091 RepID=UPI00350E9A34
MARKITGEKAKTGRREGKRIIGKKKRTKMPAKEKIRMIQDFIIPHLRKKTFGKLLEWENEAEGIFKLFWKHQSSSDWKEEHCRVFVEWSVMKENYDENDANKYTKAKDRFRNAFNKHEINGFLEKRLQEVDIIYYQLKDLNRDESNEEKVQASVHENNNYSNQIDNTSPSNISENLNENVQEMQNQVEQKSNPVWNENIPGTGKLLDFSKTRNYLDPILTVLSCR